MFDSHALFWGRVHDVYAPSCCSRVLFFLWHWSHVLLPCVFQGVREQAAVPLDMRGHGVNLRSKVKENDPRPHRDGLEGEKSISAIIRVPMSV